MTDQNSARNGATTGALAGSYFGPVGTAIGAVGGAALGYLGQKSANQNNERIARDNRKFQERMSSTARQREVKDLRKAGLNPILAAGGGGASTPPGSTAQMKNVNESLANSAKTLVPTMMQVINTQANTANVVEQAKVNTSRETLITQQAYGQLYDNQTKYPRVMEANFLKDAYEYAEQYAGQNVSMNPASILKWVVDQGQKFLAYRARRYGSTKTINTMKTPSGTHRVETTRPKK